MKIKIIIAALAMAVLAVAGFVSFQNKAQVVVSNPKFGQIIGSPLEVSGKAKGTWFFEASFPVKLLDGNGDVIAIGIAQAQGDWMTENFVPFKAELNFQNPKTKSGTLIFQKDNPSGLPENAGEFKMPVVFKENVGNRKIKISLSNSKMDPEFSCNKTFAVEREISETQAVAKAALEELLKGPTEKEKTEGFFTSINPGVKIQKLTVENGIAKVDFNDQLEFQVGGSCRVSAIRWQIVNTLKQFPTVNEVVISINGRIEDILQP